MSDDINYDIAIVGMAGRFPGARNVDVFWQNLQDGLEAVTFFQDDELRKAGIPDEIIRDPNYVKAAPILDDPAGFDSRFFGFTPRDAVLMDPQHRLLLELAWETMENAGYDTQRVDGRVGVFASCAMNTYLLLSGILSNFVDNYLPTLIGNDKDFLATRISHRLGLTGPSLSVQTACSSSLVGIHLACQSLLSEECDMALAGGAAVRVPHIAGHKFATGSVFTPDGHCRPFDARANGTIFGSGGGMVLLKRLADAIADGDSITAVIKGSAVNNDGASKAEYTAPSIESQSEVVIEALANAGVEAEEITYIETHGTGTYLGDPIEIAALTKAFRETTDANGFCAVGSVKSNIGHLDAAAGVCSLIKTALAIHHKRLPASINFDEPNPQIDFDHSPFYVNASLSDWPNRASPLYAGVTSLGIGGTNAHVVLSAPPSPIQKQQGRPWQLLPLSARSEKALDQASKELATHVKELRAGVTLADMAYTLQSGRRAFEHRRVTVTEHIGTTAEALLSTEPEVSRTGRVDGEHREIVMMFSGQGAQYPGMARGLYDRFDIFREEVDTCTEILREPLGIDIRDLMWPADQPISEHATKLAQTALTQPALFVTEYALARLLISWGVKPDLLLGHSIGEYVAACIGGVFSLENAVRLVAERGRLMQAMPGGTMLSVPLPAEEIAPMLVEPVEIACVNSSALTVLAGPDSAVAATASALGNQGIQVQRLRTSHAFHSTMMTPMLEPFADAVKASAPMAPEVPILSNLTGKRLTTEQATDPNYWARHLRETVQFDACLNEALSKPDRILIEVGPGRTLATFARQHKAKAKHVILTTMRQSADSTADTAALFDTAGRLWLNGIELVWSAMQDGECRRVPLPTYPFERHAIWPDTAPGLPNISVTSAPSTPTPPDVENLQQARAVLDNWFYAPSWQRTPLSPQPDKRLHRTWLALVNGDDLLQRVLDKLRARGDKVVEVRLGNAFAAEPNGSFVIDCCVDDHYDRVVDAFLAQNAEQYAVLHGWAYAEDDDQTTLDQLDLTLDLSMYSLLAVARALGKQEQRSTITIYAVSSQVHQVLGDDIVHAEKATMLGPVKVIPQDYTNILCRHIDIQITLPGTSLERTQLEALLRELEQPSDDTIVAFRHGSRWTETVAKFPIPAHIRADTMLRDDGVYLITGGLGGIGLAIAGDLASELSKPTLILLGRSTLPERSEWSNWLADHPDDDPTSEKLRRIMALEANGALVITEIGNVGDQAVMARIASNITERFGSVNGIIHAAGIIDRAGTIHHRSREAHDASIRSKVHGARLLEALFANQGLDFMLHCSSIATTLYHNRFGQVGYVAANSFLDALAHRPVKNGRPRVIAINWDEWGEVGMAVKAQTEFRETHNVSGPLFDPLDQCSPDEGIEVFRRVLASGKSRVMISTRDLATRIARDPFVRSPFLEAVETAPSLGSCATTRPHQNGDLTETVTAIWQQVTGIEDIGPHDNFFELGGSSLMATQVIAHIRDIVKSDMTIQMLFEHPTIAKFTRHLAASTGNDVSTDIAAPTNNEDDLEAGEL